MPTLVPSQQRRFATEIVRTLREAGFVAYWAGGCVRDQLLGRTPKDYDVACNAAPEQIRRVFGHRRTLAVGAAFGVITVLGPKKAGAVEVATFRRDADYSDGRHPDHVTFSSAEEDAQRRDFTINGLFYDPIDQRVIDFVGGREDIDRRVLRAIGCARQRFAEDKLRLLRAVRFAAALDFRLDADTRAAVGEMAREVTVVSAERIAMEMRQILTGPNRAGAIGLLLETGLAAAVLPEIVPEEQAAEDRPRRERLDRALTVFERLSQPGFPLALSVLLHELVDPAGAREVCLRWKLSNQEADRVCWLVRNHAALRGAAALRWSALQPLLISEGIGDLLALHEAACAGGPEEAAYCRRLLEQPREALDPPPLLTGDDLLAHGVSSGPIYRILLQRIRDAQLDREIDTRQEAMDLADRFLRDRGDG